MMEFKGDERFADLEFVGVTYEPAGRALKLLVSSDPADACETVVLRGVAAFDVIHFTMQNVIHYLDVAPVMVTHRQEFVELAQSEGASIVLAGDPEPDLLLGVVFVPANGAMIFALCHSVEKCLAGGKAVYSITT